jgi:hypothetical protein
MDENSGSGELVMHEPAALPARLEGRFTDRLRRCLGLSVKLVCLDPEAAKELATRSKLTGPALALAFLGTLGANFPFVHSGAELLFTGIGFFLFIVPMMAFQHLVAKALGGKATYPQFVRTMYATNTMYVAGFLPVVGAPLVATAVVWDCVVTTRAMAAVTGLSIPRAFAAFIAVTLPLLLLLL